MRKALAIPFLLLIICFVAGCNDYWWHRGQPPSVSDLLKRSELRLQQASGRYGVERSEFLALATQIDRSLGHAVELANKPGPLLGQMNASRDGFIQLEGKLSIGSRAAYGELAGQLRGMIERVEQGQPVPEATIGLFTARTRFFLANELSMPAPSFG